VLKPPITDSRELHFPAIEFGRRDASRFYLQVQMLILRGRLKL